VVTGHLEHAAPDSLEEVVIGKPPIGVDGGQEVQPRLRPLGHSAGSKPWTICAMRIASSARSVRWRFGPDVAVYPSLKTRYSIVQGRQLSASSANLMGRACQGLP
jgi:hypothetical protein